MAVVLAIAPAIIGRRHGVQVMRDELRSVLSECRSKYGQAHNAADSALADEWVPRVAGVARAGDPPCGKYRRRNMLGRAG